MHEPGRVVRPSFYFVVSSDPPPIPELVKLSVCNVKYAESAAAAAAAAAAQARSTDDLQRKKNRKKSL